MSVLALDRQKVHEDERDEDVAEDLVADVEREGGLVEGELEDILREAHANDQQEDVDKEVGPVLRASVGPTSVRRSTSRG